MKMEEKYLTAAGGQSQSLVKQESGRAGHTGPSHEQVLAWVDQVFHDLRQNKVNIEVSF